MLTASVAGVLLVPQPEPIWPVMEDTPHTSRAGCSQSIMQAARAFVTRGQGECDAVSVSSHFHVTRMLPAPRRGGIR